MAPDFNSITIAVFSTLIRFLALPTFFIIGFAVIQRHLKHKRYVCSGLKEIDEMTGFEFEECLETLFCKAGYSVTRTPNKGDFGADVILCKDGEKIAVQAKRHKRLVGIKAVQEVVGSVAKYRCTRAMVVTNSRFTKAAKELARCNQVELWDRDRLERELVRKPQAA